MSQTKKHIETPISKSATLSDLTPEVKTPWPYRQGPRVTVPLADSSTNPTRTHQSFKDECDINHIVRKANLTGQLPSLIKQNPRFGDFSEPLTYQESLNVVLHANDQFDALPSHVRARFNNDPVKFLEFTHNPENLPEMVKLGLANKRDDNSNDDAKIEPQKTTTKGSKKDTETL